MNANTQEAAEVDPTPELPNPKVVDAELAEIYRSTLLALGDLHRAAEQVHIYGGDDRVHGDGRIARSHDKHARWARSLDEMMSAPVSDARPVPYAQAVERVRALRGELDALTCGRQPLEAVYNKWKWSRFFLVTGGHIHSSMECHTLHPTTLAGWLPALSGDSEAAAVAEHGALLCTYCYPSAPVEWTNGRELEAQRKKAEQCPSSGEYVPASARAGGRYVRCPACAEVVSRTSTGRLRAHKPKAAK